jgi:hypothetical protein
MIRFSVSMLFTTDSRRQPDERILIVRLRHRNLHDGILDHLPVGTALFIKFLGDEGY